MKEITLQVEDDHYAIMEHFAKIHNEPVEKFVLTAAKSSISACIDAEENEYDFGPYEFGYHPRLGGTD